MVIRHLPYYSEQKVESGNVVEEMIKDDTTQGLGTEGKSGFIEVYDAELATTYAEIKIFDGSNESVPIPLLLGCAISYDYWDHIWAEIVTIKAVGGWIKYRVHWVPGIPEEEKA